MIQNIGDIDIVIDDIDIVIDILYCSSLGLLIYFIIVGKVVNDVSVIP